MDKYLKSQELKAEAFRLEQETLDDLFGEEDFMKPYKPTKEDVEVIQYLRPDGKKRIMYAPIGEQYVQKSKNMVCSAEELPNGTIVIYVRWDYGPEEKELIEFATNGPGDNSPNEVLKSMIDRLWDEKDSNLSK
jgi:hypothetical protein